MLGPNLYVSPDESFDRSGPVPVTLNGSARIVQSGTDPAYEALIATTNLVKNPRAAVDNSFTGVYGNQHFTSDRVELSPFGMTAFKHVRTGTGWEGRQYLAIPVTAGLVYVAGVDVSFQDPANAYLALDWFATGGVYLTTTYDWTNSFAVQGVLPNTPKRVFIKGTAPATAVEARLSVWTVTGTPGDVSYSTRAQVEQRDTPTPYADGSMGPGYAWTGTAHGSSSTRDHAWVTVPNAGHWGPKFSLVVRMTIKKSQNLAGANIFWGNDGGNWPAGPALFIEADGKVSVAPRGNGAGYARTAAAVPLDTSHVFALDWDGTTSRMWYDGVLLGTDTTYPPAILDGNMVIRNEGIGVHPLFHNVMIFDRVLTADEYGELNDVPTNLWTYSNLFEYEPQGPTGSGGVVDIVPTIYLASKTNQLLEDVTDYVLDMSYDYDIDRDGPKGTCKVVVSDVTKIPEWSWLALFQKITYEDGTFDYGQLGLYRVTQPSEVFDAASSAVSMSGFDTCVLLDDRTLTSTVNLTPGTKFTDHLKAYLSDVGVRFSVPDKAQVVPATGFEGKAGVKLVTFLNEICDAVGLYSLASDGAGVVVAMPVISSLSGSQPVREYRIGQNSEIVGTFQFDPQFSSVFNQVVVIKDDPAAGVVLTAVREFSDPASRISTVNLGVKSKTYTVQAAADQAALDALADQYIQDRTMYVNGKIAVFPAMDYGLHDTVRLDMTGMEDVPGADRYAGLYYVKGRTYDVMSSNRVMTMELRRVEYTG